MNFEQARAEYERLRQAYDSRSISHEEFARRVQELQVRDAQGTYWAIDGASGGWLRYDGASWVPGQPPAAPVSGYGAGGPGATQVGEQPAGAAYIPQAQQPAQGQYGYEQQQSGQQSAAFGYGQAQQASSQAAAPPAAAPKRRNRALIAGCASILVVALIGCAIVSFLVARSSTTSGGFLNSETGIVEATTASGVTDKNQPNPEASTFSVNNTVYITYVAKNMKQGQTISIILLRDGEPQEITGGVTDIDQDYRTLNGYFSYTPRQKGEYTVELYVDDEAEPSETVTFSVN